LISYDGGTNALNARCAFTIVSLMKISNRSIRLLKRGIKGTLSHKDVDVELSSCSKTTKAFTPCLRSTNLETVCSKRSLSSFELLQAAMIIARISECLSVT
jgi:hypothetical protein